MLEDIKITHLSLRKLNKEGDVPWGKFNIVWKVTTNPCNHYYAKEWSHQLTRCLKPVLTIPALDVDNFQDDDWDYEKHDLVREVGFNDEQLANYLSKFDAFHMVEYVAYTPPVLAVYDELEYLKQGKSLNYRTTDDCIFLNHLHTIHSYWD